MVKSITNNDLIAVLYNENPAATHELKKLILADKKLLARYLKLRKAKHQLPDLNFSPSGQCLSKILAYSRS